MTPPPDDHPHPPAAPADWSAARVCGWSFALMAAVAIYGPAYLDAIRPPALTGADFHQEWLSARHVANGGPVYAPQAETAAAYLDLPPESADTLLPWNAHPPASVLLVLPLGRLDYRDAHFAWNLLNLPLFFAALVVLLRELRVPWRGLSWLPAVTLTLACYPLYYQLGQGNLNIVLFALVTAAWAADRRGRTAWAGALVGAAAAVKLFPAFLFVYFVLARRRRALAAGVVAFVVLNAIALAVFGAGAFRTYVAEVMPSTLHFQSGRQNASLSGFLRRLLDPEPSELIVPLVHAPAAAAVLLLVTRLAVVAVVAWVAHRSTRNGDRDHAFAVAVAGMALVSPVTWPHGFLLLGLPLGLAWMRLRAWLARRLLGLVLVVVWLPAYYAPVLLGGLTVPDYLYARATITPEQNLWLISLPNYALALLFPLVLGVRVPGDTGPEVGRAGRGSRRLRPALGLTAG